jgi:hypothetical protein
MCVLQQRRERELEMENRELLRRLRPPASSPPLPDRHHPPSSSVSFTLADEFEVKGFKNPRSKAVQWMGGDSGLVSSLGRWIGGGNDRRHRMQTAAASSGSD